MIAHINDILHGLAMIDKTGFTEHVCLPVPAELLDDVLAQARQRWVTPDKPWQRYDEMWHQWQGSLPISRLQMPEHPREYATVRVWRTRVWSNDTMPHDQATYSFISVIEHGPAKTASEWVAEVSKAVLRRDLTYKALVPCTLSEEVVREVLNMKERGPIRPIRTTVHECSTGDTTLVPEGYHEIFLAYWATGEDRIVKGYWLAPWVDVLNRD